MLFGDRIVKFSYLEMFHDPNHDFILVALA